MPGRGRQPPTRWVLALAGVFAFLGILMKITDLPGRGRPTAAPERIVASDAAPPRSEHGSAPVPSGWLDDGGHALVAPAEESKTGDPLVVARNTPLDSSRFAPQNLLSQEPGPRGVPRAPHARGSRARRGAPSLEAGAATARRGHNARTAPGSAAAPRTVPGATPQPGEPSARDAIYQTGEDSRYALNQQIEVPDIGQIASQAGTVSFWLQPEWQQGNQDDASLVELGAGRLQIVKNVDFLRFQFADEAGGQGGAGAPIAHWNAGEWHQVTTTWTGNQFALYLDGQLVSQARYPGAPIQLAPDAKLLIGSDFQRGRAVAPGIIGMVDVQGRPLAPDEIANQFAAATGAGTAGTRR